MLQTILKEMRSLADPARLEGMARYGIVTTNAIGLSVPDREVGAQPP